MSTPQSEVNQELFRRVNALEQVYNETNGYLKGIVESNEKLIKLFSKALYILAAIATLSPPTKSPRTTPWTRHGLICRARRPAR